MKTTCLFGALLISTIYGTHAQAAYTPANVSPTAVPAATQPQVVQRGANHRVWQWETYEARLNGAVATHVHKYTELATGMHYQDANNRWVEAKDIIETYRGGAIARQGQYQVIFANNLNTVGAIDLKTPGGKRLRSNILGLSYYDSSTGKSALIAQIQDSTGQLISPNQVLYPNAFAGVSADVRYTYKYGIFEQDVILREQPPSPETYGLNPDTDVTSLFRAS